MSQPLLQSLFIPPRAGEDPRIAQIDRTRISTGSDGKYYKMLDSREWGRFHVLSDEEMREEMRRSTQTKENMMTLTGQFKDGQYNNKKTGIKFVPPQMGTASKSRKIEKRAWAKDISAATKNKTGTTRMDDENSDYAKTIRALQANTETEEEDHPIEPQTFEFDPSDGPEDRVGRAFHVIQKKYEQNLHVVERLYEEKMSLEEYARNLERELRRSQSRSNKLANTDHFPHSDDENANVDYRLRSSETLAPPKYDELAEFDHTLADRQSTRGRSRDWQQTNSVSTMRSHSAPRGLSRSLPHNKLTPDEFHAPTSGDENIPIAGNTESTNLRRSHSTGRGSVRSMSATRRRSEGGVSSNLLADADRYVQKRRMLEEKERLQKLEEERYLLQQKEKHLRASMNGKSFDDMFRRQEEARLKAEEKKKKEHMMELERKHKEREELAKKRREKEQKMLNAIGPGTSWQEQQQAEEQRRKERIERRKQELLMISSLPQSIEENLNRANSKKAAQTLELEAAAVQAKAKTQFRADDPAKVRLRLERKQKAWEQALTRKKEELREENSRRGSREALGGEGETTTKLPIEIRNEEYKARREAKKKEMEEKEKRELARKKAEEKAKRDKLLNMKLPDASLKETVAHKKRVEKLQKEKEAEEEAKKREAARERRKQIEMKETAALLSMAIKDRDEQLRHSNEHFELRSTDKLAHEAAIKAREEYRAKLRENKQRIQESLKNRKSLLQRHDEDMAKKTAVTTALKKVAKTVHEAAGGYDEDDLDAILSGSKSRKNSTANSTIKSTTSKLEDEIFSTKEKMIVGDV